MAATNTLLPSDCIVHRLTSTSMQCSDVWTSPTPWPTPAALAEWRHGCLVKTNGPPILDINYRYYTPWRPRAAATASLESRSALHVEDVALFSLDYLHKSLPGSGPSPILLSPKVSSDACSKSGLAVGKYTSRRGPAAKAMLKTTISAAMPL